MSKATSAERYFLQLVNEERAGYGLHPLLLETRLNDSSQLHSNWMLGNDVFSHSGNGGSSATDRLRDADFSLQDSWRVAENLAYISTDEDGTLFDEVRQLHENLMNSPGHRANILDADVDYIGIGLQVGDFKGSQVLMATQNFAATGGALKLDVSSGVTIDTVDRPAIHITSTSDWLDNHGSVTSSPTGTDGHDRIIKGAADNSVSGGVGHDLIAGGAGNDRLRGGAGHDFIQGQNGNDRVDGQNGNDVLTGGAGSDTLLGGSGRDQLAGGAGHDSLFGHKHNDLLVGGMGNDTMNGGLGQDTLVGGIGTDVLTGGGGADQFVFADKSGVDRITDFTVGQDRLLIAEDLIIGFLPDFVENQVTETNRGVQITLSQGHRILVEGSDLTAQDVADDIFLF
jgi:Ca2+-binding RTX toxin-like protein